MAFRRIIYLVRHGQVDRQSQHQGKYGSGLTALGQGQAELVGKRLEDLPIDVVHFSTLLRARQTAEIIAAHLQNVALKPSRLLWECIPYLPPEFVRWYREDYVTGRSFPPPPEMEKWLELWPQVAVDWSMVTAGQEQAGKAFEAYFRPARSAERREVIVCHGNIIRSFVTRVLRMPPEDWTEIDVHNCSISQVVVEPEGKARLISYNDTGHLPYEYRTYW